MHFNGGVILSRRVTKESTVRVIKHAVDELLFPFSEEFEIKPYIDECGCIVEARSFLKKSDRRYGKADPSCEDCNGTGKTKSTYNKFACFDWWEIGGQWDGDLAGTKGKSNSLWRNCLVVKDLPTDYYFFAIVTPTKKWHEQWQFMAGKRSEAKEIALWNDFQIKLRKKYSNNLIVLIDCHR